MHAGSPYSMAMDMDAHYLYPSHKSLPLRRFEDMDHDELFPPPPPIAHGHWAFEPPAPRIALAGSLDPTTGIFYRTPEHPRLRTAQACEKCRTRKAKCSGEHPSCARCLARGLVCEYAKEGRVRGPNRHNTKARTAASHSPAPSTASSFGAPTTGKRQRRNTTLPTASSKPGPLSSCAPLALPAHLASSCASKRRSLPASLDLSMGMGMGMGGYHAGRYESGIGAYDCSDADTASRRGSYDSYGGYDSYGSGGYARAEYAGTKPLQLEAGYALDRLGLRVESTDHPCAVHSPGPQAHFHPTPGLQHGDLGLTLDGAGVGIAARRRSRLGSEGSSSAASASSFDGESGPDSAVEGSFPLFRHPYSPPHAQASYSLHSQKLHSPHETTPSSTHSERFASSSPEFGSRHSSNSADASPYVQYAPGMGSRRHSVNATFPFDAQGRYHAPHQQLHAHGQCEHPYDATGRYTSSLGALSSPSSPGHGQYPDDGQYVHRGMYEQEGLDQQLPFSYDPSAAHSHSHSHSTFHPPTYSSALERTTTHATSALRGWVAPPNMPLPARTPGERGVSGLSVVIPGSPMSAMSGGGAGSVHSPRGIALPMLSSPLAPPMGRSASS
ncbi:hypothetical protein DFH07DRAFT_956510 [Mycena maculata]|uniref:Zn(2)-C6 fungal-type domain-containing protein n=1 Tax=Mycena maculata TaxID=230809 RepID=A0AAD7NIZ3_9AGAR|nr:hypothetical protein DFH07DRAFT_956510 [Mycena maculata]